MTFVRFSRDRRGYEHTYLMRPPSPGQSGRQQPAIIYWFRTPPGLGLGRAAFDPPTRAVLEAQNPGEIFDWERVLGTPFPQPDPAERWGERRRLAKEMKRTAAEPNALEAAPASEPEMRPGRRRRRGKGRAMEVVESTGPDRPQP